MTSKQLSELKAGATYEDLLNKAYKSISLKEIIPQQQEQLTELQTVIDTKTGQPKIVINPLQIQKNITKSNLNTFIKGKPALINEIIEYIISEDGDLVEFNKYFQTFKRAISGIRLTNLDEFKAIWTQFKLQQLGKELTPSPQITISPLIANITELQKMSSSELDQLFRETILKKEGKSIDEVNTITYRLIRGISTPLTLLNKTGIIEFKEPLKDSNVKGKMAQINNAKIKYIYGWNNPNVNMKDLKIKWTGPTSETTISSGSGLQSNPSGLQSNSSGINPLDAHFALKKKSVYMKSH